MFKGKNVAYKVSLLVGGQYIAVGIIGFFITGFNNFVQDTGDTLGSLIGIHFASINPMHNTVHIGIGLFLVLMTRYGPIVNEGALLGVGVFYIMATIIGVISPATNLAIISMHGWKDGENLAHFVTGSICLTGGLISMSATNAMARRTGLPA